ncbi:MAG: glucan 1,4-alpha-glucosidase [Methylobacteriaceae bacterium]|nr:glucan 1,4-alpha-glucosidase [Methylobacteriaceae bacterium]
MVGARPAPGHPGLEPRWTSSAKAGVGCALELSSRVSFTLSHGIVNEVYYPRIDEACTRDIGLIVTGPDGYFSEEKRDTDSIAQQIEPGVPAYALMNKSIDGRYEIEKRVIADPARDVLLQQVTFSTLMGSRSDYRLFVLVAPHLVNAGAHNSGWVESIKGWQMLFAAGRGTTLAVAASRPFRATSVGFVGISDGYQILKRHGWLAEVYDYADDGNVALCAELEFEMERSVLIALGFGRTAQEAAHHARSSIKDGYAKAEQAFVASWREWQRGLRPLRSADPSDFNDPYRVSAGILRLHEAKAFPGGIIASLSIPWGASKGDDDLGGYHLAWPRDLVQSATGLLAIGAMAQVRRVLGYLEATQESDGHWPQNMWLDGAPYWSGQQLDETGFPILLVDLALRHSAIGEEDLERFWPMIRHAARYILQNGPVTGEDRWEEDGGYSVFTLAVEIAALVVAADLAGRLGYEADAAYLLETADLWNASIERWTFAEGTELAMEARVRGYYVRISPAGTDLVPDPLKGTITIRNRPSEGADMASTAIVSPDALALVRFGLRAADDTRIRDTICVIDRLLKVDLPQGPVWRRYNEDGYGEHEDGSPFDGTGIGRPWPLLTGERAHYEIAAGRLDEARRLTATLEACAGQGGLIPEQVWDADDIPEKELFRGRPSGSARPLVWAHAEHVKLLRSLQDGAVFDTPPQVVRRYQVEKKASDLAVWRRNNMATTLEVGRRLRIEVLASGRVRWSSDGWNTAQEVHLRPTDFHIFVADLNTEALPVGAVIAFTFFWTAHDSWTGQNFTLSVSAAMPSGER